RTRYSTTPPPPAPPPLSLHDALPISQHRARLRREGGRRTAGRRAHRPEEGVERRQRSVDDCGRVRGGRPEDRRPETARSGVGVRSEEHTSELQSQSNLVCRLLLEKKK